MSKGYGAVQRAILAALADDDIGDPDGWTRLGDLAHAASCHPESARRAVFTLRTAGLVQTTMLRPVRWRRPYGWTDERIAAMPGAQLRVQHRAARRRETPHWDNPVRLVWEFPARDSARDYGNEQLHVRLSAASMSDT